MLRRAESDILIFEINDWGPFLSSPGKCPSSSLARAVLAGLESISRLRSDPLHQLVALTLRYVDMVSDGASDMTTTVYAV